MDDEDPKLEGLLNYSVYDMVRKIADEKREAHHKHFHNMMHNPDYAAGFYVCKAMVEKFLFEKRLECRNRPHIEAASERVKKNMMMLEAHTHGLLDMIESGEAFGDKYQ